MADTQLLHAMLRVSDLDRSLAFFCHFFDFSELRRIQLDDPPRTLVFIGHHSAERTEYSTMQLELWYEPGSPVITGNGHIGIGVRDLHACIAKLRAHNVPILHEPAALRAGGRMIALIKDPDGHEIELLS